MESDTCSNGTSSTNSINCNEKAFQDAMSEEANRPVREKYRQLLSDQQHAIDEAGEAGIPVYHLQHMVLEANAAFENVQRPKEAALDAEFLKNCGRLLKKNVESLQVSNLQFRPGEYARKYIQFIMHENEGGAGLLDNAVWKRSGKAVASIRIKTPTIESAFAGFDTQVVRKERKTRESQKDECTTAVKPKVIECAINEEERQTEEINRIYKVLQRRYRENGKKPLCFWEFVLNPNSYAITIENMFHTSFLISMHRAAILEDEDELPVIKPLGPTSLNGKVGESDGQAIISLSVPEFHEAVKNLNLKTPCIPPVANREKRSLE